MTRGSFWFLVGIVSTFAFFPCSKDVAATPFVPDDPYFFTETPVGFPGQWHLDKQSSGASVDINVLGAWNRGLTGQGVTIGIVDGGVEYTHSDLIANYDAAESWDFYESDSDPLPSLLETEDIHGTAVSGLAAARGGNGAGITGAAPNASLAVLRAIPPSASWSFEDETGNQRFVDAFRYHSTGPSPTIQIKNLSFAESQGRYGAARFPQVAEYDQAIVESTSAGTIFVQSAGNVRIESQFFPNREADANKLFGSHLPQVISVAAVDANGSFAEYSNFCACLSTAVPSGETLAGGGFTLIATDRSGTAGYNPSNPGYTDTFPDQAYTSVFSGTSATAPIMSGILALAKEANPNLSARFAKHLLARTSRLIDPDDASPMGGWTTNAAGFHFNNNYGFGLVDADALTLAATQYLDVSPLQISTTGDILVNEVLPENASTSVSRTFAAPDVGPLEEVLVRVVLAPEVPQPAESNEFQYGDLDIVLSSPNGTTSLVSYRSEGGSIVYLDDSSDLDWTYTTNAFWGEPAAGNWTLALRDAPSFFEDHWQMIWESFEITFRSGSLIPVADEPGDYNRDGTVDAIDYQEWQLSYGRIVSPFEGADGNGNEVVDPADYVVWRNNLGAANEPIGTTFVTPEPRSLVLAILASLFALAASRCGKRQLQDERSAARERFVATVPRRWKDALKTTLWRA